MTVDRMTVDRGVLAKIDRRLLAELDHAYGFRLVKVPVSEAVWSTWRRYCDAAGLSMGRAIAALIYCELRTALGEDLEPATVLLTAMKRHQAEIADSLATKLAAVAGREATVAAQERRVRIREAWLDGYERRIEPGSPPPVQPQVGRNESCPCGSGMKFKRCHGSGPRADR